MKAFIYAQQYAHITNDSIGEILFILTELETFIKTDVKENHMHSPYAGVFFLISPKHFV